MCGFIGKVSYENIDHESLENCNKLIECRGPDNKNNHKGVSGNRENLYFDLIFNRLSILDLADNASQPMISEKFGTTILFNGEIYNHNELRKKIESKGIKFNTSHSDTEVLLNGLSHYGEQFLNQIRGQFAIVFLDLEKNKLLFARDRLGQKPLFYKICKDSLIFSSNLKSIVQNQNDFDLDENSVFKYLELGVVPSPNTIFKNIRKVAPGQLINFQFNDSSIEAQKSQYWEIEDYVSYEEFNEKKFYSLFDEAVSIRSQADVPVANFLSGGIDSTSIIKSQIQNSIDVNTYSVGYLNSKYDESKWFNLVSSKYKTNHISEFVNLADINKLVIESIQIFDEPYSDPSTLPSYLISKLISQKYKVAISGDGGDELLGGYLRTAKMFANSRIPFAAQIYNLYPSIFGSGNRILQKSYDDLLAYSSFFQDNKLMNLLGIGNSSFELAHILKNDHTAYKNFQLIEYKLYLMEMMMLKVDRTSMASSLEVRSPFVDHKLVEYVLSCQNSYYDHKNPKSLLKKFIKDDFSDDFLNRKKMGFVFDVETYIYNNFEYLFDELSEVENFGIKRQNIEKLRTIKSRINANRLWKILFLENYLKSTKKLISY